MVIVFLKWMFQKLHLDELLPEGYIRVEEAEFQKYLSLILCVIIQLYQIEIMVLDSGFYPFGSCTMKYNPKINENVARFNGFAHIHPYQDRKTVQGALELMYDLQEHLTEITGMDASNASTSRWCTWRMDWINDDSCLS